MRLANSWRRRLGNGGFAAAPRKAFVGDGQDANWAVWRRHFSHYTPILDFIHAICYVFAAAVAGRPLREGGPIYCQWAQWVWSGEVQRVIEAVRRSSTGIGLAGKGRGRVAAMQSGRRIAVLAEPEVADALRRVPS